MGPASTLENASEQQLEALREQKRRAGPIKRRLADLMSKRMQVSMSSASSGNLREAFKRAQDVEALRSQLHAGAVPAQPSLQQQTEPMEPPQKKPETSNKKKDVPDSSSSDSSSANPDPNELGVYWQLAT